MQRRVLIALASGVVIGVMGGQLFLGDGRKNADQEPPVHGGGVAAGAEVVSATSHLPLHSSDLADPTRVETRVELSDTSKSEDDPHSSIGTDGTAIQELLSLMVPPTDEELEQRFGHLDMAGLKGAEAGINWVLMRDVEAILTDKLRRGEYVSTRVDEGEAIAQKGSYPDGSSRIAKHNFVKLPDGGFEHQVAEISSNSNPLIMTRMAEIEWLVLRMRHLERQAGTPK